MKSEYAARVPLASGRFRGGDGARTPLKGCGAQLPGPQSICDPQNGVGWKQGAQSTASGVVNLLTFKGRKAVGAMRSCGDRWTYLPATLGGHHTKEVIPGQRPGDVFLEPRFPERTSELAWGWFPACAPGDWTPSALSGSTLPLSGACPGRAAQLQAPRTGWGWRAGAEK